MPTNERTDSTINQTRMEPKTLGPTRSVSAAMAAKATTTASYHHNNHPRNMSLSARTSLLLLLMSYLPS
jgi:hypothetical protein